MTEIKNSLMKKKKAELVAIILRKDDVEKELRTKVNELEGKCFALDSAKDKLKCDISLYKHEITELNNDNNSLNSDLTELTEQLGKKNKTIAELQETIDDNVDVLASFEETKQYLAMKFFTIGLAIPLIGIAITYLIKMI